MINLYTILNIILILSTLFLVLLRYSTILNTILLIIAVLIVVSQNLYYKRKKIPILTSWIYIISFFFYQSVFGSYSFMESSFYSNDKYHYFHKEPIYFYISFMTFVAVVVLHFIYVKYLFFHIYRMYGERNLYFSYKYKFFIYIVIIFLILYLAFYKELYQFYEGINVLYVPFLLFLSIYLYKARKKDLTYFIAIFVIVVVMVKFFGSRYVLFSYLLTVIGIVYYDWVTKTYNNIQIKRIVMYLVIFFATFFYLIIAFFAKKRSFQESISLLLADPDFFLWGIKHLYYRTIEIYSHLSSIFIEYVNNHDFFYGLTYIKQIYALVTGTSSDLYNPNIITALLYQGYGYAMPGVIGEGYGNFGILGIFFVPLIIFPILFFFELNFFRYKRPFWALMYISGYPELIFNAASINHYLSFVVVVFIIYTIFYIIKNSVKR